MIPIGNSLVTVLTDNSPRKLNMEQEPINYLHPPNCKPVTSIIVCQLILSWDIRISNGNGGIPHDSLINIIFPVNKMRILMM